MLSLYPFNNLGHAKHGWLEARHHFSFASYNNPKRLGFGGLLVVNDDIIAPHTGFNTHSHSNMEIITYVRQGAITHKDSLGNEGRTAAGDVQVMSAGTGVSHSEHNLENEATRLYQIWIKPKTQDIAPRWEAAEFPKQMANKALQVLVSGRPEHQTLGALYIHQDAAIYVGKLAKGTLLTQAIKYQAYVLASLGSFTLNGMLMKQGDGAEFVPNTSTNTSEHNMLRIQAEIDCELLVIDVPF